MVVVATMHTFNLRQRQGDLHEFEAKLDYRVSSKILGATQRNPLPQKDKEKKQLKPSKTLSAVPLVSPFPLPYVRASRQRTHDHNCWVCVVQCRTSTYLMMTAGKKRSAFLFFFFLYLKKNTI